MTNFHSIDVAVELFVDVCPCLHMLLLFICFVISRMSGPYKSIGKVEANCIYI